MTTSPQINATTASPPRSPINWRTWKIPVAILLLCGAVLGGYHGWNWLVERQYRLKCEEAKRSEDWRTEREVAKAWVAWHSGCNAAWWFAAEAAQVLEDPEDVADCLGHISSDDPKAIHAYIEKANLEWSVLNRPLEAVATSERILALDPKVAEIQSRLISFYAMSLQRTSMLRAIRSAIAAKAEPPEAYVYLMLADNLSFSNGADLNSRWLVASPDELRFKIGLAVNTAGNIFRNSDVAASPNFLELKKEAVQQLEWFLDGAPHDPVLLTYLMNIAYEAGNAERVGELLQKVDDTGTGDHMVWFYRGWYHVEMKELVQAEEALREALRLHPMCGLAHHEYARLLRIQQRPSTEVLQQQRLAAAGKGIRGRLLILPNARDIPWDLLEQIAIYAAECGEQQIADALATRIVASVGAMPSTISEPQKKQSDNADAAKTLP